MVKEMILRKKLKFIVLYATVLVLFNLGTSNSQKVTQQLGEKLSINLKAKALVIGPRIKLGDIGTVLIADSLKRAKVLELEIGLAPPPGESTEISLSKIKKRLQAAGFADLLSFVNGPSVIRVTTAQMEIDKALLTEEYATAIIHLRNSWSFAKFKKLILSS